MSRSETVLALSSGSASLSFAIFADATDGAAVRGDLEGVGLDDGHITVLDSSGEVLLDEDRDLPDHETAYRQAVDWLAEHHEGGVAVVGHRVVHGGFCRFDPAPLGDALLDDLRGLVPLAPVHLPQAIRGVALAREAYPDALHLAVFDTHFGRDLPRVAQMLPLPRRFWERGLRRVGFHGLSYESLVRTLRREHADVADGLVVLIHLGGGASMAAVRGGHPVETTMGVTPAGGLVTTTRTGDLDPGVLTHLARIDGLSPDDLDHLVQTQAGLFGVSGGRSGSVQDLLAAEGEVEAAADALALYVHSARRHLGALVAVLCGLDAVAFTGGIGTGVPEARARICDGFDFLGLRLNPERNESGERRLSDDDSGVLVLQMKADEAAEIARQCRAYIQDYEPTD